MKKSLLLLISISSFCLLNACGGGSGGGTRQLLLASTVPPAATASVAYPGFTFTVASGGTVPFTWSESGALPPGLALSNGGALSGTPTNAGSFPITVTVKDSSSPQQTASQGVTILVNNRGTLAINSTPAPPSGTVGNVYPSFPFMATGGVAPLIWSETGALPPGLILSNGGALSGTPTNAGSFPITVTVKDSSSPQQTASQGVTILVNNRGTLAINSTPAPPSGTVGNVYPSFPFMATGGVAPLIWSETGALPPGLILSNGGALSGTPTGAGSFPITVMVQDSLGENATPQNFTIQISNQASGFIPAGSMETPRQSHTATMLNTGKVILTGGADSSTSSLATAELFDPATGNFTPTGNMETVRAGHTATLLNDGRVLVTGGKEGGICLDRSCFVVGNSGNSLATAELFDPATGNFTPTGNMETVRAGHTATLLGDGRVLVAGGVDNSGIAFATAELFDPTTGSFTSTGSMETVRAGHTATLLGDGRVLVAGGVDNNRNGLITSGVPALATAELFDPATGRFAPAGTMETARARHAATLISDGKVLMTGGVDRFAFAIATAELFDPASDTFTPIGSMVTARESHTATLRKDGTVLVAGGAMLGPAFCGDRCPQFAMVSLSKAELFDPATKTFTGTGDLATARFLHTATLLNDGSVLVTGGADSKVIGGLQISTVLSTTELFQ